MSDHTAAIGPDTRLGFGTSPAVLAIDMARAYIEQSSPLYAGVEDAVASAADLLEYARDAGVPVVHTRVRYQPGLRDAGVFGRKLPALSVFEEGNHLAEFVEMVAPRHGESVISKQYASAFFGTALASLLNAEGHDTVIIVGLSTSGCVRATAVDACQHGFVPIVVRQAVGDRTEQVHETNLFDLHTKYADVLDQEEVTRHLATQHRERKEAGT